VQRKNEASNKEILLYTTGSVIIETCGLASVLAISTAIPVLRDFPILSLLLIIFCSSTIQSAINGSALSIASNQIRRPNTVPGDTSWYANLRKPFFNPPGWVFPVMWLLVCKPTQLLATLVLMERIPTPWLPLTVFCAHLALGDAWNKVFFGLQRIRLGTIIISMFYGMLMLSTALFYDLDPNAGLLLLPTCAWVMVATALNFEIYRLNK
jgi:tryptophan-rich sensory protein